LSLHLTDQALNVESFFSCLKQIVDGLAHLFLPKFVGISFAHSFKNILKIVFIDFSINPFHEETSESFVFFERELFILSSLLNVLGG